jgi:RNA polymerase sigma factor (sigma-70 family)
MQHFHKISVIISMYNVKESSGQDQAIRKVLRGDKGAFEEIVENYQKLVMHIVFRMIHGNSDREDICQDIFVKVYQNLSSYRGEAKLSTWIAKIAYNTCLNHLEKRKKERMNRSLDENEHHIIYDNTSNAPDDYIETQDIWRKVQQEMGNIPPRYRVILSLYHMDNLGYREIGEIMNLPEGTVKNYLFRARQKLKSQLMKKYQPEEIS